MNQSLNIARIKRVASALNGLNSKVVFVGGATISLYPDRPVAEVRTTEDIDVIVAIISYSERVALEEKLRSIGFRHDIESGVVCRYRLDEIVVDIMPTDDNSIGFSNRWYVEGFEKAVVYAIDEETKINILSPTYFLATKLEAHKGRGKDDGRSSQDFEDIVFVLENRESIWNEINDANGNLKSYFKEEFAILMNNPNLFEWIDSHVERGSAPATDRIIAQIKKFIDI